MKVYSQEPSAAARDVDIELGVKLKLLAQLEGVKLRL